MLTLTLSPDADCREAFERSFDFSKFPNLQEVDFGVGLLAGNLLWIPTALSTLKPPTSPHLSVIRIDFGHSYIPNSSFEMVNDLRRVAYEVARIERDFGGVVKSSVFPDPTVKVALERLNVTFHSHGAVDSRNTAMYSRTAGFIYLNNPEHHPARSLAR